MVSYEMSLLEPSSDCIIGNIRPASTRAMCCPCFGYKTSENDHVIMSDSQANSDTCSIYFLPVE